MIKGNVKKIVSIALIIIILCILQANTFAVSNPDYYNPNQTKQDNTLFYAKASVVIGWIKYIGIIVSIITLSIIGIKYMFSSVEGKAEYKKTMFPYIVGCFMVAGISVLLSIISYLAKF